MQTQHQFLWNAPATNLVLFVLAAVFLPLRGSADDAPKAATQTTQVDHDVPFQGEFIGAVSTEASETLRWGLQIRAQGDGTFAALQFAGGLPGQDWDGSPPLKLIGIRSDNLLVLSGGKWAVLVRGDDCLLVDADGNRVGRLERVDRQSPTLGASPTKDAIVLFDGSQKHQFSGARVNQDGSLLAGAITKPMFHDFNLHLEFMLPFRPASALGKRVNSGVYLQQRYEVQIMDSFALDVGDQECGALYKFKPSAVNMCFPPLIWQTYDIVFTAARWAADNTKLQNVRISVWHNGVRIHDNVELLAPTGAGEPEAPSLLPIRLQDHGAPVLYRNIWIVDRGARPSDRFPPQLSAEHAAANK